MSREAFAANNRGIAAGGNLEDSFLNEIYDHIRANPISLKEDDYVREREGALQVRQPLRDSLYNVNAKIRRFCISLKYSIILESDLK